MGCMISKKNHTTDDDETLPAPRRCKLPSLPTPFAHHGKKPVSPPAEPEERRPPVTNREYYSALRRVLNLSSECSANFEIHRAARFAFDCEFSDDWTALRNEAWPLS